MTEDRSRRDASSTSHPRPSRPFPHSDTASSRSGSAGRPPGLGAAELRDLAERHGFAPRRSLGQHFLLDPNVARAIVRDAGIGPGDRVIEIGAGLGSLTLALDARSEEHTSELQSRENLVCRLLLEKKKIKLKKPL